MIIGLIKPTNIYTIRQWIKTKSKWVCHTKKTRNANLRLKNNTRYWWITFCERKIGFFFIHLRRSLRRNSFIIQMSYSKGLQRECEGNFNSVCLSQETVYFISCRKIDLLQKFNLNKWFSFRFNFLIWYFIPGRFLSKFG